MDKGRRGQKSKVLADVTCVCSLKAASGDLRTPVDVYCFGVVLLQVVSGLKTHDEGREEKNIVSVRRDWL